SASVASSGVARRRMRWEPGAEASARLHPLHPVPHFLAATGPSADTRPKSSPRSTSTMTGSCKASGSGDGQVKYSLRFPLNRTSTTSVNGSTHFSVSAPMERYFSSRRLRSLSILILRSWRTWRCSVSPSASAAASGSAWAAPGVGARGVHQRDHGGAELLGEVHETQRLAVALGMGHPEIAPQVLLRVTTLLVPDDHDTDAVEPRPPRDHRRVVAEQPVAVQL